MLILSPAPIALNSLDRNNLLFRSQEPCGRGTVGEEEEVADGYYEGDRARDDHKPSSEVS